MNLAAESHVDRSIDRSGRVHRDQHRRNLPDPEFRPGLLARPSGGTQEPLSLPPCFDGRGVRRPSLRRRHVRRGNALCAVLALFRLQGGLGPSGAGLARNLWPAGRALQLLQQLRAVPLPRKAHPAGHPERARREAAAGLWRRRQCARLAVRRGPCARAGACRDQGAAGRELQCRRQFGADQSERRRDDLRPSRRQAAANRRQELPRPDRLSSPTAPATTAAMRSTRPRSAATSAGRPGRASTAAWRGPSTGSSTTNGGGRPIREQRYAGERLGEARKGAA